MTKSDEAAGTPVRGAAVRFPCAGTGVEFGDIATGAAVITELTRKTTKQGKPMASFTARNALGSAAMPIWSEQLALVEGLAVGQPVALTCERVAGRDGLPEWKFISAALLPPNHAVAREAQPQAPVSRAILIERTLRIKDALSPDARALFDLLMQTPVEWPDGPLAPIQTRFLEAPAAIGHHHACTNGLWWHSLSVSELAISTAEMLRITDAPSIDVDMVRFAAFFHDIGKLDEYGWTSDYVIAPRGAMASHMAWGMLRVREIVTRAECGTSWRPTVRQRHLIDGLLHVISSHHGQKEWGATATPCSREAWCVSTADLLSSRVQPITDAIGTGTALGDGWARVKVGWRRELHYFSPDVEAADPETDAAESAALLSLTMPAASPEVPDAA